MNKKFGISMQNDNDRMKKKEIGIVIIFIVCILYPVITNRLIPSSKLSSDEGKLTKYTLYKDILDSDHVTALEYIEIEQEESTFFLTLTEVGITVIELEPSNATDWRMACEYGIDNISLEDYLDVHGLYWDTILLSDGTLLIYGICNPELNIKEIKTTVSGRYIYEYTMEENKRLFFIDINDKNLTTITVQGMDDTSRVIAELCR